MQRNGTGAGRERFEENLPSEILISSDPWENRVAILEDGDLAELYIEREEKVIGSIYKGKVQNVLPGMGAAFVDIGLGRNAFLYVDDINKQPLNIGDVEITQGHSGFTITEKVKRGDDILVQIVKEPRGLKGARISTNISLPGRYLILMPTGRYSGVSRKIESEQERNRLKAVMKRIRPEGMATVVRTAANGVSEAELIADLGVLIRMWHGILETYKRAASPSLLHKDMNLVYKAARDFITPDVERVLIDDEEEYRKVRDFLQLLGPQYLSRVEYYNSGRSLFEDYKINDELQKLMKPKINLPSGGSIVIESTEALTVIDVNSGKFTGGRNLEDTILKTNLEAAQEVARQVRLRDIGGIIVVDFIDMSSENSRNRVIKTLEEGLRRDRTRATIQSFSNLGLLEFTRKRVGKDLGAQLRGACPTCSGMGSVMSSQSVAIEAFRHIRKEGSNGRPGEVLAHVAPTVAAQMEFWYEEECEELARELERHIHVRVDPMLHPEKMRVDIVPSIKDAKEHAVRVGDEHDVELLPGRLPNATSAAAVVEGRLVEVESAANNAGNFARIRILDVDDDEDYVLAELVTAGVPAAAKKKRRRGRGRKAELTPTEQAKQLRELAEEAARQAQARPPIGITTVTEEEEAQDKALAAERRAEEQADAIIIGESETEREGEGEGGRRKRRRRRRGRGRGLVHAAAETAAGEEPAVEEAQPGPAFVPGVPGAEGEGQRRHRRRRRRRRGRGGAGPEMAAAEPLTGSLPGSPTVPDRHIFRVGSDGSASATGTTAPREPSRAIAPVRPAKPPATEPPPPSLTVREEQPKKTKPARRRRAAVNGVAGQLEGTAIPALPSAGPAAKPRRAPSRKAAGAAESSASVPTRRPRKKVEPESSAAKPAAGKARAKKTAAQEAPGIDGAVKKPAARKKKAAAASGTRKKA
ncbi:MAG TPA: Rne/Rng family ribonuclease [Candidatus Acidoferrales bacterium]|nr:Rne/Rng family ribonuclease [Candidatus Acidoferrales bacterium]